MMKIERRLTKIFGTFLKSNLENKFCETLLFHSSFSRRRKTRADKTQTMAYSGRRKLSGKLKTVKTFSNIQDRWRHPRQLNAVLGCKDNCKWLQTCMFLSFQLEDNDGSKG